MAGVWCSIGRAMPSGLSSAIIARVWRSGQSHVHIRLVRAAWAFEREFAKLPPAGRHVGLTVRTVRPIVGDCNLSLYWSGGPDACRQNFRQTSRW